MTNSRDKGDRGEREVVKLIHDLSGHPAHRLRTPGHEADQGDIGGVPNTVVEVKWWDNPIAAIRQALPQAQRASDSAGPVGLTEHGRRTAGSAPRPRQPGWPTSPSAVGIVGSACTRVLASGGPGAYHHRDRWRAGRPAVT